MIDRTFQIAPGIGPYRERELWKRGVRTWSEFPADQVAVSAKVDPLLRDAIGRAQAALSANDPAALAELLPRRERWRLLPHFAADAAYLDIETDGVSETCEVTCVGVLWRGQVFAFVNGYNLDDFPAFAEQLKVLVTFNGICFDVPVLERYFRHLKMPRAHIDARFAAQHAGISGGLKRIEDDLGLARPDHLRGVGGYEAVLLWRAWRDTGNREALRRLVEYNLYDAIQLKPVLERIYNRMRDRELSGAEPLVETERGDALYDVTATVASVDAWAARITDSESAA